MREVQLKKSDTSKKTGWLNEVMKETKKELDKTPDKFDGIWDIIAIASFIIAIALLFISVAGVFKAPFI